MLRPLAGLEVARASESDWEQVRSVRLAALAESPRAFGSSLAEEREYDDADWREWCRDTATYLALLDGVPIGMAAGVDGTSPAERKLIAMWLEPVHRGGGAASGLLAAVRASARRDGAGTLMLWVTRGNDAATRFYKRAGFVETGISKPLPSDSTLFEDQLALHLR